MTTPNSSTFAWVFKRHWHVPKMRSQSGMASIWRRWGTLCYAGQRDARPSLCGQSVSGYSCKQNGRALAGNAGSDPVPASSRAICRVAAGAIANRGSTCFRPEQGRCRHSCIAALHNKSCSADQKPGIMALVFSHCGSLPVPPQQLFPSGGFKSPHFMGRDFRWPIFLSFV